MERLSTGSEKHVAVSIMMMALDPSLFNRGVYPVLKIAVTHLEKLMTSQYSADSDFIFCEHQEDLLRCVIVCAHVMPPIFRESIRVAPQAERSSALYPPSLYEIVSSRNSFQRWPSPRRRRRRRVLRLLVDQRRDAAHRDATIEALGRVGPHLEELLAIALRYQVLRRHLELLG